MIVHFRALTRDLKGIAYAQCGGCTKPVVAILGPTGATSINWGTWNSPHLPLVDVVADAKAQVLEVVPTPIKTAAPEHVPPDTVRVFVQAKNAQKRGENDTAGMGFRKTLDIGLKAFDQTVKGTLIERIDKLAAAHRITPDMKEWAHQVRLIGNEINHEEDEPTDADVEAIAGFTEATLQYLFTLPKEVENRRAATATAVSSST